jgi:cytosine/creatinine deaminase
MRTHVEVDPRIGLRGFEAVRRLKKDFAWAIDVQICVFPQEGLLNDPGTDELLVQAIEDGADLVGGCPYTDSDPKGQIARIFELAGRYDLDIDIHLDFHLDPARMDLDEVCRQAKLHRRGGRVAVGHVSSLRPWTWRGSSRSPRCRRQRGRADRSSVDRPVPDGARERGHSVPRGVAPAHLVRRARRRVLAGDQQRAEPLHAVRRLLASAHGEPLRQHRPDRLAGRDRTRASTWSRPARRA